LPTHAQIPTFIQQLHHPPSPNPLPLHTLLPHLPLNHPPIHNFPYQISITPKYNHINQFPTDVPPLSPIITFHSLKISHLSHPKNTKHTKNHTLTLTPIPTTYKPPPSHQLAAELPPQHTQAQGDSQNRQP
ncbi:type 4a pilus biogenesis protein PilO, partial [Neisseria sicca]|uniref:type 4a pilus biogenesis protein PilO n=1 Tax=Neisseria sicca TaxID=490 RepID=UPI001649957D